MFAPCSVAGFQVAPPSVLTSTRLIEPPPDHERPLSTCGLPGRELRAERELEGALHDLAS